MLVVPSFFKRVLTKNYRLTFYAYEADRKMVALSLKKTGPCFLAIFRPIFNPPSFLNTFYQLLIVLRNLPRF